jgi:DNA-binding GntR family transcriptional regulator
MIRQSVALDPWRGVQNALRAAILAGEYPPGTRLVEQQLADQFGTSRGPIRSALRELERTGLVVTVDRRGTFVRRHSSQDVEEILSLWSILWPFVLRRAAARVGPDERRWLEDFRAASPPDGTADELIEYGIDFAREIFRIASHRRALDIFESLTTQARSLFVSDGENADRNYHHNTRDFDLVCSALLDGDVDQAIEGASGWSWLVEASVDDDTTPAESGDDSDTTAG